MEYPTWVLNPVLVPKPNGLCRMGIDFTSLNKYIPKRPYFLPKIYQLVDAMSDHALLCFVDVHKGYHQILMVVVDEKKTSLVRPLGLYCYKHIPFWIDEHKCRISKYDE